jgi:hypothetical protein
MREMDFPVRCSSDMTDGRRPSIDTALSLLKKIHLSNYLIPYFLDKRQECCDDKKLANVLGITYVFARKIISPETLKNRRKRTKKHEWRSFSPQHP